MNFGIDKGNEINAIIIILANFNYKQIEEIIKAIQLA